MIRRAQIVFVKKPVVIIPYFTIPRLVTPFQALTFTTLSPFHAAQAERSKEACILPYKVILLPYEI